MRKKQNKILRFSCACFQASESGRVFSNLLLLWLYYVRIDNVIIVFVCVWACIGFALLSLSLSLSLIVCTAHTYAVWSSFYAVSMLFFCFEAKNYEGLPNSLLLDAVFNAIQCVLFYTQCYSTGKKIFFLKLSLWFIFRSFLLNASRTNKK